MSIPLYCRWTGEAFEPATSLWAKRADQEYVVGEVYHMAPIEERSASSHRHYFAALHDAWANLPEDIADRFMTVDHLRRYALIRTGYRDERSIVASSAAEARRIAAFIKPMDEFAVVSVHESAVLVWTAKSQSMRAMGKAMFQRSKDDVLSFVAEIIGVAPEKLGSAA